MLCEALSHVTYTYTRRLPHELDLSPVVAVLYVVPDKVMPFLLALRILTSLKQWNGSLFTQWSRRHSHLLALYKCGVLLDRTH